VRKVHGDRMFSMKTVQLHVKAIRDLAFRPQADNLLLSVGFDGNAILTDCRSDVSVLRYSAGCQLWSCAWDETDDNLLYCGSQKGDIYTYDIRVTGRFLSHIVAPDLSSTTGAGSRIPIPRLISLENKG